MSPSVLIPAELRQLATLYAQERPRSFPDELGIIFLVVFLTPIWPCDAASLRRRIRECLATVQTPEARRTITGFGEHLLLWLEFPHCYPAGYPYSDDLAEEAA